MSRTLSLEDELSGDLAPEAGATDLVAVTTLLDEADAQSRVALTDLSDVQDTLVALEAVSQRLQKDDPRQLGRSGVLFANLAVEALCALGRVALTGRTISLEDYTREPEVAVNNGVNSLEQTKEALLKIVHDQLTTQLTLLSKRRDVLNKEVGQLWKELTALDNAVEALPPEAAFSATIRPWQGMEMLCYAKRGERSSFPMVPDSCRIVNDIGHFLTEHSHLYKRLIKKQLDWINDHKDNLLKGADGFAQYVFHPVEYLCSGEQREAEIEPNEGKTIWRSVQLPGMMAFFTETPAGVLSGHEAILALAECHAWIAEDSVLVREHVIDRSNVENSDIPRLSVLDCRARLSEMKRALGDLSHWADIAFCKLWKDAYFEQEVLATLLKAQPDSLTERALTDMAHAVILQLNEAASYVPQYVLNVYHNLLRYVARSLDIDKED